MTQAQSVMAMVDRADLVAALDLALMKRTEGGVVRFDFRPGEVEIAGPGSGTVIDAECEGRLTAQVDAWMLRQLAPVLAPGPRLALTVEGGSIRIGTTRLSLVASMDIAPRPVMVPLNSDVSHIIAALEQEGEIPVIATLGLPAVQAARAELDRLVGNAWVELHLFGVTREDLEALVHTALARRSRRRG